MPETIVIDHGKIYLSEHLTSVCQQMGISIQPARLRTGRDKGPVERFFRTRMNYIQAAIRGQVDDRESAERRRLRAANDQTSVVAGRGLTPSNPQMGRTGTLTASVATAPARSWALWLILPLAGAALGTLAVRAGFDRVTSEPRANAVEATPAPTDAPPEQPEMVKWFFNTDPQGATVTIDGQALEGVTPTSVQLRRGDETVLVRVELAGYKSREVVMAPLSPENHSLRLEPAYKTTFTARSVDAVEPDTSEVGTKKRTRPRNRKKDSTEPVAVEAPPKGDAREPEDLPDFLKGDPAP